MNTCGNSAIRLRIACALMLIPAAHSVAAAQQQQTIDNPSDRLMATLEDTVADFDYDREDFDRIVDDLRARFDLNIHVSWSALESAGIERDQRTTIKLKQVPLTTFLDFLLQEAADDHEMAGVDYFVKSGVLMLATEQTTRPPTVLRTYDVTDLIESGYSIRRFANTPVLSLRVTGREFAGGEKVDKAGGGAGGGSVFGDPGENPARYSRMERVQQYIDLIVRYVTPEAWVQNGGNVASMYAVNGSLFVRHTVQAHNKIADLLEMVRATKPQPLDADAVIVRIRPGEIDQWRADAGDSFPRLSADTARELFGDSEATDALFRGTTSGFNGERLWFSAVSQRDVLAGLIPTVGERINAFGTAKGIVTDGLELVVLPLLMPDGESAEVDVQFAWIPPTKVSQRTYTPASNAEQTSIDLAHRRMRTVSSTVHLDIGQAVALAIPETPEADDEYEEWLVVRVRAAGER